MIRKRFIVEYEGRRSGRHFIVFDEREDAELYASERRNARITTTESEDQWPDE